MSGDLWEEAFACARRSAKVRQMLSRSSSIGDAERRHLEKLATELEQRSAALKARAAASPGEQESSRRKRILRSRRTAGSSPT